MNRAFLLVCCGALLLYSPARAESFLRKLLRITGVSATPSQQKASGQEMKDGGEIWLAQVKNGALRKVSDGSGFRSPIFTADDSAILALKGEVLWRVSLRDEKPQKLHAIDGLTKLVGADRDDPDKILVVLERARKPIAALVSLKTGETTELPHDPSSSEDRKLLSHLQEWERVYGEAKVYPQAQTRESLTGEVEWSDVMLKKEGAAPVNLSRGNGIDCGQPSLSRDATQVVFIRAKS